MGEGLSTKSALRIELSEEIFDLLTRVMNEIHEQEFSFRFCKIFLEDHVRAVINHKEKLDSGDKNSFSPHILSLNISFSPWREKFRYFWVQYAKYLMTIGNVSKREEILKKYSHLTIGFSNLQQSPNEYTSHELPSYYPVFMGNGDVFKRRKVHEIAEKYDDSFKRNIVRLLPGLAVEHFQNVYDKIKLIQPGKKVFHAHVLRFSVYDGLFIAKYIKHGSQLTWYQEGAECAELESKYSRYYQYSVSNEYRTWGWKMAVKDVPWKAYPLLKFRSKYLKFKNDRIYDLLLCFPEINSGNRSFHKTNTEYILNNLKPKENYQILARPYPVSRRKSNKKKLDFIDNGMVLKSSGLSPIMEEISKSELVLQMEIPSTNFLECIFINHPTIGLLLNDQPTEIIKPYYDFFIKNGVLHRDIKSLVHFLNHADLNKWWPALMNDATMKEFKNKFTGIKC